jgi:arsenate reductase-like glutaredoxin family protein
MDNTTVSNINDNIMSDEDLKDTLNSMSTDEVLHVVAITLLTEKGFTDLDDDTKRDMVEDLVQREYEFINRSIIAALPAEGKAELDQLVESGEVTAEAMQGIVDKSGIDANAITEEAMKKFREIYLADHKEMEE